MTCEAMYPFNAPDSGAKRRPFSVAVYTPSDLSGGKERTLRDWLADIPKDRYRTPKETMVRLSNHWRVRHCLYVDEVSKTKRWLIVLAVTTLAFIFVALLT